MKISVITPIYNERENIKPLLLQIKSALEHFDYEVILVDDGSRDGSVDVLKELGKLHDQRFKVILFRKNCGQTAALAAGFDYASGDVIVPIDSDLEHDPADIPKLVKKLDEGYDVVSGWRVNRWQGELFTKKIPSMTANWLVSKVSGVKLHDTGCTLKAYRAEVVKNIPLYGDMHRFIAAYAFWNGAHVTELPVNFRTRTYGQSNYGLGRIWRTVLDLITMKFMFGYAARPLHLFGLAGFASIFFGIASGALAVYLKFFSALKADFVQTPLPVIMAMLVVVGVMLIMLGLLAEIIMRTYHESQGKKIYNIKDKINL